MDRIEDCLSFTAGKAYQQIQQEAKRRLAPFGVTPGQYAVLKVLWERDAQSLAALGARLVLDSATMTGLIDRLSRDGLAERRAHPDDRRVHCVCLTRAGRALQTPVDAEMDAMHADMAARVGAREFKALLDRLRRFTERLTAAPATPAPHA